jgi:hypothetical protein
MMGHAAPTTHETPMVLEAVEVGEAADQMHHSTRADQMVMHTSQHPYANCSSHGEVLSSSGKVPLGIYPTICSYSGMTLNPTRWHILVDGSKLLDISRQLRCNDRKL